MQLKLENNQKTNYCNLLLSFLIIGIILSPSYLNIVIFISSVFYCYQIFKKKNYDVFKEKWFLICCIMFIYYLINSLNSNYLSGALLKSFHFLNFFIFSLAIKNYILDTNQKKKFFLKIIFFSLSIVVIDVFIQFLFLKDILGNDLTSAGRLTGPFKNAIPGSIMSKFFLFWFMFYLCKYNKNNLITILIVSFFSFVLLVTTERMAILIFIGSLTLVIFFEKSLRKNLLIIFLILPSLCTFIFFTNHSFQSKIYYTFQSIGITNVPLNLKNFYYEAKTVYDNPYGVILLSSYEIWKENKFFGTGIRSFRYECEKVNDDLIKVKAPSYYKKKCNTHPHNLYSEILSETGLVGLLIVMIFAFYIFYLGFLNFFVKKNNFENKFFLFSLICVVMIFFPFKTSGSYFSSFEGGLNWLFIGIYLSSLKKQ